MRGGAHVKSAQIEIISTSLPSGNPRRDRRQAGRPHPSHSRPEGPFSPTQRTLCREAHAPCRPGGASAYRDGRAGLRLPRGPDVSVPARVSGGPGRLPGMPGDLRAVPGCGSILLAASMPTLSRILRLSDRVVATPLSPHARGRGPRHQHPRVDGHAAEVRRQGVLRATPASGADVLPVQRPPGGDHGGACREGAGHPAPERPAPGQQQAVGRGSGAGKWRGSGRARDGAAGSGDDPGTARRETAR